MNCGDAQAHMTDVVIQLPKFTEENGQWKLDGEIEDGKIYEIAFDGTDAHAEIIEKHTGLTFLGDSTNEYNAEKTVPHEWEKQTKRRVILAKTY